MRISVLTICRNGMPYLTSAVSSVIKQVGVDFEYVLKDAGSSDGSLQFMQSLRDSRVRVLSGEDSGPAHGLNLALLEASGDVISYVNSDDELVPGALSWIHDYFDRNPHVGVIHGGGELMDEFGNTKRVVFPRPLTPWMIFAGITYAFQPSTFFRKRCLCASPFNEDNPISWDLELLLKLLGEGAVVRRVPIILSRFRQHEASLTGSGLHEGLGRLHLKRMSYEFGTQLDRFVGLLFRHPARAFLALESRYRLPARLERT